MKSDYAKGFIEAEPSDSELRTCIGMIFKNFYFKHVTKNFGLKDNWEAL